MIDLRNEKGKGVLQAIIILIIIFLVIYLLVKFFPSFHKSYEFKETMQKEARAARSTPGFEDVVIKNLLAKAAQLGLNIDKGNLKVQIERGIATIEADYYIEIKTFFYTFKRHFTPKVENPIFM